MKVDNTKKENEELSSHNALADVMERKEILETVINNSPVIAFLWTAGPDEDQELWPVEFVSENVDQLGYSVEDFLSGRVLYADIVYPEDLPQVQEALSESCRMGEDFFDQEYRISLKSGDIRWVNEKTYIQRDDQGNVTHYQGTIFDITDQKNVEVSLSEALKKQDALETIIDNSPVIVFLWRAEEFWPADYVSNNVIRLGYPAEDFIQGRILYGDLVHPEDQEMVRTELDKRCDAGYDDFDQEYRVITRDGQTIWVNEKTFIQRDENGNPTHFQGIILDITKLKEDEKELKELVRTQKELLARKEALENILNHSPVIAFLWKAGPEGEEELWPAEFVSKNISQLGYSVDDFISGKTLYGNIIHPDDLLDVQTELSDTCKEGGNVFVKEYRIYNGSGELRWVKEQTFIQRDGGVVTHYQGIIQDITSYKNSD